jgi:DNA-binding NtrC family response regulator
MVPSFTWSFPATVPSCEAIPVLLLDDDYGFRSALAANLREDGHEVREYARPRELPALASLAGIAVVITDYEMPDTNGVTFADAFHAVHPTVPIVLVTANGVHARRRDFLYLQQKPVDYEEMHRLVHDLAAHPNG